jgi:L-lactate dehydrogenase complex protein LldG
MTPDLPPTTPPTPPTLDESVIRQVAPSADLVERWIERATFHSIKVHRTTAAAVPAALDACLAPHTVTRSLLNAHELEARFALPAYLAARRIQAIPWGSPDCANAAFSCELAITDCRAALADTGSVMVWSDATFGRSSTLVIPIHIVLLPAERILADLIDGLAFMQRQSPGRLSSNIVLINGPSKTADIEMNLITGVHGPKHLYVVVIEDE